MRTRREFYFYRGNMIERLGKGWGWTEEMCKGEEDNIPVYKTIMDAKNAINKFIDGSNRKEPRIVQWAAWKNYVGYYIKEENRK